MATRATGRRAIGRRRASAGTSIPRHDRTSMDAPFDASFSSNGSVHVVRCCRLSGLLVRQLSWPLACMEIRGPSPYRLRELRCSPFGCWFSRPRLIDRLPLPVLRPAHIPNSCPPLGFPPFARSGGGSVSPIDLLLRRKRPDNARHPVRQRYRDQHPGLACQHPG